jgi:putative glycosyl hydrolase-like family 15 (GHL15) protein
MSVPFRGPRYRGLVFTCSLLFAVILHCGPAIADVGTVRLARGAESSFDAYTQSPSPTTQDFIRSKFWRMRTYSPYFDTRLSWDSNAWAYQDSYAIYPNSAEATQHPDWILRDANGNKLWIQFACGGGACTQYAADIGNPAFRSWWIASAKAKLAAGYRGLFIDDVNMAQRISNGNGTYTLPVDPRTGQPMDETAWQHYMADFMSQVRAALPGVELVENSIWTVGDGSADLRKQLDSADYVEVERGFNDAGIVGGSSKFGWETLMSFIDHRHAAGRHVVLDGYADTDAGRLYGLATYFLVNDGGDALANDAQTLPDSFWSGYDVDLGASVGNRYQSAGVWRRDFSGGLVLANEPGAPTRTVTVGPGYHDLDGVARTSVTLGAASGAVLVRDGVKPADPPQAPTQTTVSTTPTPTPTPTPTATPSPTPAPTVTPVPETVPVSAPVPAKPSSSHRRAKTRARAASVVRKGRVSVHGRVRGATSGKVKLTVQKRRGRHWKTARRASTRVSAGGVYRRTLSRLHHGTYRVRASYLGSDTARPSRSHFHRFAVR